MSVPAASLKRQAFKDALYRTAALAVFVALAVSLFRSTIFFIPCVIAVAFLYLAAIAKIVLAGRISEPVYLSLRVFAVTLLFTTFFMSSGLPPAAGRVAPAIFLIGAIGALHFTAKAYSEISGVATLSMLIAAAGYLYYSLFAASGVPLLPDLGLIVLAGFAGTAVCAFIGIVSGHSNPWISATGNVFSGLRGPAAAGAAAAVIVTYIAFVRPSLVTLGSLWVTLFEWGVMGIVIVLVFLKIRSLVPREDLLPFGSGHTIAGRVSFEKGEIAELTPAIEAFVATGKRDGLATLTTAVLLKNDVPVATVQKVVSNVVDYREAPEPPLLFKWAQGDLAAARSKKRMAAVNEMMAAADAAVNNGQQGRD